MNMSLTPHLTFKTPSSAQRGFLRVIGNATYLIKTYFEIVEKLKKIRNK